MRKLYWIMDKRKRKVKFRRNRAQVHFNKHKSLRNIILKSRQLGFTTDECIDALDDVLFTPGADALLIAHKKEEAYKIFSKKIHYAWKNLNPELKHHLRWVVDTNRTNALKFDFPGGEESSISVSTSGRSGTYSRIHISEFAKLCKSYPQTADEVISGTIPAAPPTARVDIESTAEGEEDEFYNMFWEAWERGEPKFPTQYKAHFYNWTWDDDELDSITPEQINEFLSSKDYTKYHIGLKGSFKNYQNKHGLSDREITYWYTKWISLNHKFSKLFNQYPTTPEEAFAYSGVKLFEREAVDKQKQYEKEGTKVGHWTYFADYQPGHVYAGAADVSHGKGRDSSTIVIMDFTPHRPRVVAVYENNEIDATVFAYEIKNGGERYGNCLMAPENNDRGYATCVELSKIYANIFVRKIEGKTEEQETKELGWKTTGSTKPQMMLDLKTAYNDELLEVADKRINREARTYDENDVDRVKFDKEQTRHWDLLTALAICWQMRKYIVYESDGGFSHNKKKDLS